MPTFTQTQVLADVAAAIAVETPMLSNVASDFTAERLKKGQTAIAHIGSRPAVIDFDAAEGYGESAAETSSLFADRSVTISSHKHVPIKLSYLRSISDQKEVYQNAIAESAAALGKAVVDDGLSKVVAANFSQATTEATANVDRDTLGDLRKEMNKLGAATRGRFAVVNSDAFENLDADTRIASRDFYGQSTDGNALGVLNNVAGFSQVLEYPDLPGNSENLTGVALAPDAMCIKTGIPDDSESIREALGIPQIGSFETITDPASGLTLMAVYWQQPGTFDIHMSITLLWGWAVGKAGGSAGDLTDYSGRRLISA